MLRRYALIRQIRTKIASVARPPPGWAGVRGLPAPGGTTAAAATRPAERNGPTGAERPSPGRGDGAVPLPGTSGWTSGWTSGAPDGNDPAGRPGGSTGHGPGPAGPLVGGRVTAASRTAARRAEPAGRHGSAVPALTGPAAGQGQPHGRKRRWTVGHGPSGRQRNRTARWTARRRHRAKPHERRGRSAERRTPLPPGAGRVRPAGAGATCGTRSARRPGGGRSGSARVRARR